MHTLPLVAFIFRLPKAGFFKQFKNVLKADNDKSVGKKISFVLINMLFLKRIKTSKA